MTEKYFSPLWSAIAPGLANHLWQSTLVAAAAGLLTLALRKHHARARYWLWLAASIKFLIPFSVLVRLGAYFAWRRPAPPASTALYFAIEEASQPFSHIAVRSTVAHSATVAASNLPSVLPVLIAIWLVGFLTVLFVWIIRWRRIFAAMRTATPLNYGREVGTLRRMERIAGIRKPIELLVSRASLEPGIFGIARPTLIWPEGISKRLEDPHLEAVLAHEVWHVRRRDNLSAMLHMLVEAVFWFYPLVWWLGARLVEERERSCDEEVVALGSDRQIYAESILKVCEFCLGSPLPCVAGVTGADLKKRMVHIMTDRISHKLDFARKALLAVAATLAIAIPVTFGLLHATPSQAQPQAEAASTAAPVFDSVTIKPNNSPDPPQYAKIMFSLDDGTFKARGVTLRKLIELAYHMQDSGLTGGPDWLDTARFDIDTQVKSAPSATSEKAGPKGRHFDDQPWLKILLANYFKVSVHPESRNLPVYELAVDDAGSKLQPTKDPGMFHLGNGELASQGVPIELLADQLSERLGRTVVDRTGLKGFYAFNLRWTPDPNENVHETQVISRNPGGVSAVAPAPVPTPSSNFLAAVQEQLGLKLEAKTEPVSVLVIDHVEQPAQN
jgi:bla regulator protein BlaR1